MIILAHLLHYSYLFNQQQIYIFMSWVNKTGKSDKAPADAPKAEAEPDIRIIEEENDVPMEKVTYMRIGSAHAVERNDRDMLATLLSKYLKVINEEYDQPSDTNNITFDERY